MVRLKRYFVLGLMLFVLLGLVPKNVLADAGCDACKASTGNGFIVDCAAGEYYPPTTKTRCYCTNSTTRFNCPQAISGFNCNINASWNCPTCSDTSWGSCTGGTCGWTGTETSNCGNTRACYVGACCTVSSPGAPTLNLPGTGSQLRINTPASFTWNGNGWGTGCPSNNNSYDIDIPGKTSGWSNVGGTTSTNWTPTVGNSSVTWSVRANNGSASTTASQNICVEGGAVISAWGACNGATHKRTRTCSENCGADDCAGTALTEDCLGEVRGTVFDASDYGSCPAPDANGYLTGLSSGLGAPTRSFGFTGPWSPPVSATTNSSGNYAVQEYAPGTYSYNFNALSDIYVTSSPKLTCVSAVAVVPDNPSGCLSQPCSIVKNISFGFWKMYGGWWQVVGGNVYGQTGIKSVIPSSLTTEMSLILPDASAGNRRGILSYGVTRPFEMLGKNLNAKVSASLWEKESKYDGQIYDWNFYNTRFKRYVTTAWSDGQAIVYKDLDAGYQIFKSNGSITSFDFNPATKLQKAIFIVNGNVKITGNVTVPVDGFLAVIASGTITFDTNVSRADGWYVAGSIAVPCKDTGPVGCDKTDSQFAGNGSFIGWNGISLERTRGITNNSAPSEIFTYRPDLYLSAPEPMKIFLKYYKPFVP